jgi:hypothetical protein
MGHVQQQQQSPPPPQQQQQGASSVPRCVCVCVFLRVAFGVGAPVVSAFTRSNRSSFRPSLFHHGTQARIQARPHPQPGHAVWQARCVCGFVWMGGWVIRGMFALFMSCFAGSRSSCLVQWGGAAFFSSSLLFIISLPMPNQNRCGGARCGALSPGQVPLRTVNTMHAALRCHFALLL